jgi:hypothetical protein
LEGFGGGAVSKPDGPDLPPDPDETDLEGAVEEVFTLGSDLDYSGYTDPEAEEDEVWWARPLTSHDRDVIAENRARAERGEPPDENQEAP